eukprot:Hpha_TRINITY_DN27761_c0_g1::TRINITY_DN27761_c0_g1_i1::g.157039::m.157039
MMSLHPYTEAYLTSAASSTTAPGWGRKSGAATPTSSRPPPGRGSRRSRRDVVSDSTRSSGVSGGTEHSAYSSPTSDTTGRDAGGGRMVEAMRQLREQQRNVVAEQEAQFEMLRNQLSRFPFNQQQQPHQQLLRHSTLAPSHNPSSWCSAASTATRVPGHHPPLPPGPPPGYPQAQPAAPP